MFMERDLMTYIERTVNVQTGEIIEQPYSDKQIEEVELRKIELEKLVIKQAEAAAAKAALLAKLGITEEEARLLLGGN